MSLHEMAAERMPLIGTLHVARHGMRGTECTAPLVWHRMQVRRRMDAMEARLAALEHFVTEVPPGSRPSSPAPLSMSAPEL